MKILVVGGGGREHALVWKIAQSPLVAKIYCAPGNPGIANLADCVHIPADEIEALLDFAEAEKIDLTVVGPEVPLVAMVSRLVDQKGFGELCGPTHGSLYNICSELGLQFVILGTGEAWCEEELGKLADRLPNLAVDLEFNEPLAHLIMAGSDFLLVPSAF